MSRAVEAADVLRRLGACDDAIAWLRDRSAHVAPELRTAEAAWADCERGDWLVWLVTRPAVAAAVGDRALRLIACDCAERALPLYEARFPDDDRPRHAIEVSRRYAYGLASANELCAVRYAAYTAAAYAAAHAASYADRAAYAASRAAYAATNADAAAADAAAADANYAAATADEASTTWAATADERRTQAEIVRQRVPWAVVRDALRPIALEVAS